MTWCPPRPDRLCPAALPELMHALNHPGDVLASQFDQILNLSGLFAPLLPLDPNLRFWAPLDYTLNDLRGSAPTFTRSTAAIWRRDDGQYFLLPSNSPRFEDRQLLMEAAITNKVTAYNAVDLQSSGWSTGGATLRIVDAQAELAAAGLLSIVPGGQVYELENETAGNTSVYMGGPHGNSNVHTVSCWMNTFGNDIQYGLSNTLAFFNTTELVRCVFTGQPDSDSRRQAWILNPGEKMHVILMQTEEALGVSSPIITQGAAASRSADTLRYSNPDAWFNQSAGMALVTLTPLSELLDNPSGDRSVLGLGVNAANLIYHNNVEWRTYDGAQIPRVSIQRPSLSLSHWVCARWGGAQFEIGVSRNGEPWRWGDSRAYGSFPSDNYLSVLQYIAFPYRVSDAQVWDEDRGRAWVEENYP